MLSLLLFFFLLFLNCANQIIKAIWYLTSVGTVVLLLHTWGFFFPSRTQHVLLWLLARCITLAWPTTGKLVGGDEPTTMGNRRGGWAVCISKPSQHNPEPSWPQGILRMCSSSVGGALELPYVVAKWNMVIKRSRSLGIKYPQSLSKVKADKLVRDYQQLLKELFGLFRLIFWIYGNIYCFPHNRTQAKCSIT